jgi:hypothetical protein
VFPQFEGLLHLLVVMSLLLAGWLTRASLSRDTGGVEWFVGNFSSELITRYDDSRTFVDTFGTGSQGFCHGELTLGMLNLCEIHIFLYL